MKNIYDLVITSQKTPCLRVVMTSLLQLFRKIMAVHSMSYTKSVSTACGENLFLFDIKTDLKPKLAGEIGNKLNVAGKS